MLLDYIILQEDSKKKKDEKPDKEGKTTNEEDFSDLDNSEDDTVSYEDDDTITDENTDTKNDEGDDELSDLGDEPEDDTVSYDDTDNTEQSDEEPTDDGNEEEYTDEDIPTDEEDNPESTQKNKLIKEKFVDMYNFMQDLIEKISSIETCSREESTILKQTEDQLDLAKNNCYNYITDKLDGCKYEENLYNYLLFSTTITMVNKILEKILENRNKEEEKDTKNS